MTEASPDSQISDVRQAMRLEPFHPLVADHMMAGVSLAALEITVALCRTIRWSDYNEKYKRNKRVYH